MKKYKFLVNVANFRIYFNGLFRNFEPDPQEKYLSLKEEKKEEKKEYLSFF